MFKHEIKDYIAKIRTKWLLKNEAPDNDYILLNQFFNDIYTDNQDTIFLCFTKDEEHTYYSFKSSIINPTYQEDLTVPFWFYCKEFSQIEGMNVFICPNTFRFPRKKKNAIHQTNCLFCDIDDKDINFIDMSKDEIKNYLNSNFPLTQKIMPAYVNVSGHGLHLYFVVDTLEFYDVVLNSINEDDLKTRENLERSLITYFKADVKCLDLPREMRLPFSFNFKNSEKLRTNLYCFEEGQYLTINEMSIYLQSKNDIDNYFTEQNHLKHGKNKGSSIRKKKDGEPSGVVSFAEDQISYYYKNRKMKKTKNSTMNIILDLEDYYKARKGYTGFRKDFFFIYVLKLKQFGFAKDDCLYRCYELNYNEELVKEINRIVKYQYENDYKITNLKIHEHLKFTELEINLFRCAYTLERQELDKKNRLKRLSEKRKKERDVKNTKEFQIELVKNNPDMTRQDLADILGVSVRTISNIRKQLKDVA